MALLLLSTLEVAVNIPPPPNETPNPCKKSRKDVKPITNYFSPVPKPVEKPFSPPRSNNIRDYFSRKTPSSKEKSSPPQDLKENSQKPQPEEKHTNEEVGKKSSEKRGRKTSRAVKKLESKDSTSDAAISHGTLGSDTAALLLKLNAETCESEICKTASDKKTKRDSPQQRDRKFENTDDIEPKQNTTALSPRFEVKQVKKAARKSTKRQQKESKHPEPEEKEADRSLCDVSMNVRLGETSELNSSTVTISFEDFVRSQSQSIIEDPGKERDGKNKEKAEELNCKQLDVPKAEESLPSPSTSKRRSNVVLQEEDLELAVIESESTPKCSEVERKQFMAAFKQPSLDGSKTKPVKNQNKQKQPEEKAMEAAEDGDVSVLPAEPSHKESKTFKKKSGKKGRNKANNKQEEVHTSPILNESKKRQKAKKLVEKAKMIQQSKKTTEKEMLRRSSRNKTSVKKSYLIVCVFSTSGSKVSSFGQDKSARKASAVISIFDDSSREGSDNSQDDEQFRARREFLKSGLPESFRKQMAKTAATKEAYSASSSSFQPVSHTTQSPIGRILSHSSMVYPLKLTILSLESVKEELLWTDKYQPQLSADIIDNTSAVKRLYSWLKDWKLRADRDERKNQKDKKPEEEWDRGGEDYQDAEDTLCNTVLITGPTGVGKTAAVYACAQELGFKVFEVSASSQRSGRLILSQLKEATQSHQVDNQGVNAHKPAYFNSYGLSSRKVSSPRKVVSSPRKNPQSPRGAKKGGLAPTSLAKFFKMAQPANKEPQKLEHTAPSKKVIKANESSDKNKSPATSSPKQKSSEEQSKKTATSLILFEEVDVIFDDDSGFLAAIKTFMSTTKRPVILTTSDPAFSAIGDYLQLLCLAEDTRTHPSDISSLLKLNGCDVRQSLLQLQFWARSAGGRPSTSMFSSFCTEIELKPEAVDKSVTVTSSLPPCDTGCTESKLGLLNIEPDGDIWELLGVNVFSKETWQILLADSRRRGVNLLYSNMEKLLPLPLTQLSTSNCSPVKVSSRMKKNKKRRHLPTRDGLNSDSDSEDGFLSLSKRQNDPHTEKVKERVVSERVKRKPLTAEEQIKTVPVSQCLQSIADFWDNMSFVDSSLCFHPDGLSSYRRSSFSAVIKDGMTDELRVENGRESWTTGSCVVEIQAAVEALSFHKCQASVAEAWDKVQQLEGDLREEAAEELTLPVASHREDYSFTQDGLSCPQLVLQRMEVMENLFDKIFGTLGNRQAAALDYLPTMRTICRSEQLKEQGKVKRRFLHYLDAIHLGLEKSTQQFLAEDFP
uniref:ATPase family AAA domain containing 5a n=1 Tax=Xiphophorus couchianus TaxID=32473 RepID=A0A3B5MLK7_9TELE